MLWRGWVEINGNLSKEPLSTSCGKNNTEGLPMRLFHLLKSPDFRLQVLRCAGSYSRVFTVFHSTRKSVQRYVHNDKQVQIQNRASPPQAFSRTLDSLNLNFVGYQRHNFKSQQS